MTFNNVYLFSQNISNINEIIVASLKDINKIRVFSEMRNLAKCLDYF